MRLPKGSTRDSSLVRLAGSDEVTDAACELRVDNVQHVCNHHGAVGTAHVHLSVLVDCDRPRKRSQDCVRLVSVSKYFPVGILENPHVIGVRLLEFKVHVVFYGEQELAHFGNVNDFECFLAPQVHNGQHSSVSAREMALEARSARESTFF